MRKVVRGPLTEFKYERGVQPSPKLGDWVEALTEVLEKEAKLPKRERRSTQRLFEELRGRGYDGAHDSVLMHQPTFDSLVRVSVAAREFVVVFYLHRERCGLFVRFSQLLRKRAPFPNNLVPDIHLVHFGALNFSPSLTSRRLYSAT